jgi:hypothetical protein
MAGQAEGLRAQWDPQPDKGGDRHLRGDVSHLKGAVRIRTLDYPRDGARGEEGVPVPSPSDIPGEPLPEETEHPDGSYDRVRGRCVHVP